VSKAFDDVDLNDNQFVKELFKKARTAAKKHDSAQRALDKMKAGGKVDDDQKKKIENLATYQRCVEESIETLQMFAKCQPPSTKDKQDSATD
jgi:hypothetical protein